MDINSLVSKIDKERLEKRLKLLVQTKSISGQEGEAISLLKEWLGKFSNPIVDESGGLYAKNHKDKGFLMLEGHVDTVEAGDITNWRYPPFSGKTVDGKIYGRGSVDMKGGLIGMLEAFQIATEADLDVNLTFAVSIMEEPFEGFSIKKIVEKTGRPSLAVIGEPSNLDLTIGHRGRAVIKITMHGRTAHASMPEQGLNSILGACNAINVLNTFSQSLPVHNMLGKGSLAITGIRSIPCGGPIIPDITEIFIDRRFIIGVDRLKLLEQIRSLLRSQDIRCSVEFVRKRVKTYTGYEENLEAFFPAWLQEDEKLINHMLRGLRAVGLNPRHRAWIFGTDGSYLAGMINVPCIGIGPGDEKLAHKPNEMISIDDVYNSVKAYLAIIEGYRQLSTAF